MTDRIWILGAPDPEMAAIESLLRDCGERVVYALSDRGERVTAATAYRCPPPEVPEGSTVYAVECFDVLPDGWVRIDHHRPGDPGYGRPPHEFFAASSIGQVIAELARLGVLPTGQRVSSYQWVGDRAGEARARNQWFTWATEKRTAFDGGARIQEFRAPYRVAPCDGYYVTVEHVSGILEFEASPDERRDGGSVRVAPDKIVRVHVPHDLVLTAAADHCLGAAYRGECPGVDPDALMHWRVAQRAAFQGRSVEQLLADIEATTSALREAFACDPIYLEEPGPGCGDPQCSCHLDAVPRVADMRREPPWPELPEASCRTGIGYVAGPLPSPDGRRKITCSGNAQQIRAFLEHWAPQQGLVDCYGDPARGFAGGYLPQGEH